MMIPGIVDYSLAFTQSVLAVLLWHQAEPKVRRARGALRGWCVIFLGFVLAWSVPLAWMRPLTDDPQHWERTMRDLALVLCGLCFYRHAMRVGREAEA